MLAPLAYESFFAKTCRHENLLRLAAHTLQDKHMGLIEDELSEVKRICERVIAGCKLVSCVKTMVRAEIRKTGFKTLVVCIQFPENYPGSPLLLELKSKTLSEKLLQRLTDVCEAELKKAPGKPQVLNLLKFLRAFLDENPLSCCFDEINFLKQKFDSGTDELKLKQKNSSIGLKLAQGKYLLNAKIAVPDNYPDVAIE